MVVSQTIHAWPSILTTMRLPSTNLIFAFLLMQVHWPRVLRIPGSTTKFEKWRLYIFLIWYCLIVFFFKLLFLPGNYRKLMLQSRQLKQLSPNAACSSSLYRSLMKNNYSGLKFASSFFLSSFSLYLSIFRPLLTTNFDICSFLHSFVLDNFLRCLQILKTVVKR